MDNNGRIATTGQKLIGVLSNLITVREKKKTNVTDTSKEAYKAVTKDGTIKKQTDLVLSLIQQYGPVTSRHLSYLSSKERTSVTRTLYDLEEMGKIKFPFTAICPTTKKRVRYYTLIDWKGTEDGN